jgi:tetratricopeptide (TPR) repeat protein
MLDRRMRCLDSALGELRAELELFAAADAELVDAAPSAAALQDVERCGNLEAMANELDPPRSAQKADIDALAARLEKLEALSNAGRLADAKVLLPDVLATAHRIGYLSIEAQARQLQAGMMVFSGEYQAGIAALREVVPLAERAHDDRTLWQVWRMLAFADLQIGRDEDGLWWANDADAVAERMHLKTELEVAALRARFLVRLGRSAEAEAEVRRALPLLDEMSPSNSAVAASRDLSRDLFAGALLEMGHAEEALPLFQRNLTVMVQTFGREHPNTRKQTNNLIACLLALERYPEALALAEPLVELDRRLFGSQHPSTAIALINLGEAEQGAGRLRPALAHLREAVAVLDQRRIGGELLVEALTHLGMAEHALDQPTASATLRRALSVGESAKLSPLILAPTSFALAQALPAHDAERATQLATRARDAWAVSAKSGDTSAARQRDRSEAWLASRDQ